MDAVSISIVGDTVYIYGNKEEVKSILEKLKEVIEIDEIYDGMCG